MNDTFTYTATDDDERVEATALTYESDRTPRVIVSRISDRPGNSVMILDFDLTVRNVIQLRGVDRGGVSTSARVWGVIEDAVEGHEYLSMPET